ncbi:hypothetical protein [Brevundimonas sp.]|uniref:hypothetical protein n=1 Tax=Brevundimonas sp. TaxID=1871086 RepID=UPI003BAD1C06
MTRVRDILIITLALAAAPLGTASAAQAATAQVAASADVMLQVDGSRREKARSEAQNGRRMDLSDIVRMVESGREGRMLGVRPQGENYVVRWEYRGGRIVDITVDGRTGRIIGER